MARYEILINCSRVYSLFSHDNCNDTITDCKQPQFLAIELDHEPSVSEIDLLNEKYTIPSCTQTGCKRFLSSTVCKSITPNTNGFTIDDFTLK